ncbi:class I SAM-dependent methyltransferase [Streptomyces sp. H27-D2]|uniref:class I SAM-dependent methyltransferase n=1 Tax=Streptomyces sp. H27-D2 TaxID=3046304 RepID=UPI002DB93710|nr:class I SAM-dependent methyltransferase [Streptomyces sp. H27-D2]MEC4019933.1 class I SAM-dependent methyltransferase [Streptomyces sp. H27-D2]
MTRPQRRTRRHRGIPWTAALALAALGAGTVRARNRLHGLPVLSAPAPAPGPGGETRILPHGWCLITARGVDADDDTLRAAVAHAQRERLQVLDLLPVGLAAERALGLLRLLDPATYREDRAAQGYGAGCAVLVAAEVRERAGLDDPQDRPHPQELFRLIRRLKEYAPDATGVAVAPGLTSAPPGPDDLTDRAEELRAQGLPAGLLSAAQLGGLALLGAAAVRNRRWGAAAAALYWLQPYLVLGPGSPLRPADLARATATRPLRSLRAARGGFNGSREAAARRSGELRTAYAAELADGTDRFFEARRPDCPWCGSAELTVRVRVPDLLQGKPGRFTLEQCGPCGHTFQNPRLSLDGLDFYYRDFYDGLGGDGTGEIFGRFSRSYRDRARMLKPFATPTAWLDVGTGHGHFCNSARTIWPETRFDGLDMGEAIHEAERRGWVQTGYRGQFPDLADALTGHYDAISMYHYLEHTRDPFAELDAAAKALTPGGHLLIELPDPESRLARLIGPHWLPWFQPQHQHLIPSGNLRQALDARGFTVLAQQNGAAHQGNDFVGAVALTANRLAPDPHAPWSPAELTPARRAAGHAVRAVALPCYAAAAALDVLRTAAARGNDGGNAYRLIARKERG